MNNLHQHVSLRPYTTFQIGGPADYFYGASDTAQTIDVLQWAREQKLPVLILGGGSNMLIPDDGFRGLVLQPQFKALHVAGNEVIAGSGALLSELIHQTLSHGLVGLEFLAGIPGTIGGAVVGNAGTYGVDIASVVTMLEYIDLDTLRVEEKLVEEITFGYRDSSLKQQNSMLTAVSFQLNSGDVSTSQKLIDERLAIRAAKHPHEPSAGCIFKNIIMSQTDLTKIESEGLDIEQFQKYDKIPAGFLIEQCGLKGFHIGGAQVSPRHANYIVNTGKATAEDVIKLMSLIKQKVRDTYGIQLQEEVRLIYN